MSLEALIVVAVAGGLIAGAIADSKGQSFGGYFVIGLILPILGILLALVAQPSRLGKLTPAQGGRGWWPDPTGRFEHRWFDGRQWTKEVARDGTKFEDPV